MKYKVEIRLRPGIKDNESIAIFRAANTMADLGENQIISLRMGKWFELEVEDGYDIELICKLLLSNSVIEDYNIMEIEENAERNSMNTQNNP